MTYDLTNKIKPEHNITITINMASGLRAFAASFNLTDEEKQLLTNPENRFTLSGETYLFELEEEAVLHFLQYEEEQPIKIGSTGIIE